MRCPKCGHDNPHGKIVCARCGSRLRVSATAGGPQQNPQEFMGYLKADLVRLAVVTTVVIAASAALGLLIR